MAECDVTCGCGGGCASEVPALETASQPLQVLSWSLAILESRFPANPFWASALLLDLFWRNADVTDPSYSLTMRMLEL